MFDKLISVIVPIYNGEGYIATFMDMLRKQTIQNFEVIMVDDGSVDNSLEILKLYEDNRNFVFHQKNKGVSSARNFGIKESRGDIFIFPDIDDVIAEDYLEKLVSCLTDNVQLGFCGYSEEKNGVVNYKYIPKIVEYTDRLTFINNMVKHHGICSALWNKVYSADIVRDNKIFFDESVTIGEDLLFTMEYLKYVDRINSNADILYVYKINPSGALNRSNSAQVYKDEWNSEWIALQKSETLLQSMLPNKNSIELKNKKFRVASKLLYFSQKLNYEMPDGIKGQLKKELHSNFFTFFLSSHDSFRMKFRIFKRLLLSV